MKNLTSLEYYDNQRHIYRHADDLFSISKNKFIPDGVSQYGDQG